MAEKIVIKDLGEADAALRKMKEAEVELAKIDLNLNEQQLDMLKVVSKKVVKAVEIMVDMTVAIKEYAMKNKEFLFSGAKSVKLPHGIIKYTDGRASIQISDKTLKLLQDLGLKDAIRTFDPEVNLQALSNYDDATLKRVGAKRVKTPSVSCETAKMDARKAAA